MVAHSVSGYFKNSRDRPWKGLGSSFGNGSKFENLDFPGQCQEIAR